MSGGPRKDGWDKANVLIGAIGALVGIVSLVLGIHNFGGERAPEPPQEPQAPSAQQDPAGDVVEGHTADTHPREAPAPSRLSPDAVAASRFMAATDDHPAYPPQNAFDSDRETAWSLIDPIGGSEWIEAQFTAPVQLARVSIVPGYDRPHPRWGDLFVAHGRARRISIETGSGRSTYDVPDGSRRFDVALDRRATRVRIVIDDVAPGQRWATLSVSEIALFGSR